MVPFVPVDAAVGLNPAIGTFILTIAKIRLYPKLTSKPLARIVKLLGKTPIHD